MYELQLFVKSLAQGCKKEYTGILTKRLHAFLFATMQRKNPQLADILHERKERQLFSPFFSYHQLVIRSPRREVIQCLQQSMLEEDIIHLGDWRGRIQEMYYQKIDVDQIVKQLSPILTFQFLTPTTFYQSGNYYPLPELNRLFISANKVLAICEQNSLSNEAIYDLTRKIRIEHVSIKTKRVDFGKFRVIGFCGRLVINLKALSLEEQLQMTKLAVYGSLMGFGYKTAWGLGQTQLSSFVNVE